MKMVFFWRESEAWNDRILRPANSILEKEYDTKGLILNFLNDDEGLGLKYLTNWIDNGLIEVEKIKQGKLDFYDMWGQAFGAEITRNNVLVYWDYGEISEDENMTFESFYTILTKWSSFIKTIPNIENKVVFTC